MEPVRILHCADLHLDRPFPGLEPEVARRRTEELFSAFRRAVDLALERDVQVFLVAGDLFEHRWVRPETLQRVASQFQRLAPRPVLIAPGNHDPLVPGSPYLTFPWPENVTVFGPAWRVVELPRCRVWGRGFDRWEVPDRPLADLPALPRWADGPQLIVLHGSAPVRAGTELEEGPYAPFTPEELAASGADYVALGHFHSFQVVALRPDGTPLACYTGSAEGLPATRPGPHGVLVGEVGPAGVHLELVPVGLREFVQGQVDVTGCTTHEEVAERIRQAFPPEERNRHLYRITLVGRYARDLGELHPDRLAELLAADFYYLRLRVAAGPQWDLAALAGARDLTGAFVRRMLGALEQARDPGERRRLELALQYGLDELEREVAR